MIKAETTLQTQRDRLVQFESDRNEVERLAPLVEEQRMMESRLGDLQKLIGEMSGLEQRISRAEGELTEFRKEYSQLNRQVEDAESQKGLAERAPQLEEEVDQHGATARRRKRKRKRLAASLSKMGFP